MTEVNVSVVLSTNGKITEAGWAVLDRAYGPPAGDVHGSPYPDDEVGQIWRACDLQECTQESMHMWYCRFREDRGSYLAVMLKGD